jgi:hypothetical protein
MHVSIGLPWPTHAHAHNTLSRKRLDGVIADSVVSYARIFMLARRV